ncbi:MAG: DUF3710 domain-containing protein [Propionibacteriaceae bacterium]|nr:DUF3710 domain-containing protein [Propionibacteriaceae bacterium]
MIFRRRRSDSPSTPTSPSSAVSPDELEEYEDEDQYDEADLAEADADELGSGDSPVEYEDEWAELDASRDWREDGPFDVHEIDLEVDEVDRIDLGALIVTPEPGVGLQLVVDPATGQATTLRVVAAADAVMEVRLLAAPAKSGFVSELRRRLIEQTKAEKGRHQLLAGPFGTEIRRVVRMAQEDGVEASRQVRDWLVAGPRWVLQARLLGRAAADTKAKGPAAELEEFFRNLIVRRGESAQVPGSAIALTPPEA